MTTIEKIVLYSTLVIAVLAQWQAYRATAALLTLNDAIEKNAKRAHEILTRMQKPV